MIYDRVQQCTIHVYNGALCEIIQRFKNRIVRNERARNVHVNGNAWAAKQIKILKSRCPTAGENVDGNRE